MCRLHALACLLLFLSIQLVRAQSCYWPNGIESTAADNFTSCASGGHSQCCGSGDACMSNGLCFSPSRGAVYRGGCTDSSWETSECPRFCTNMDAFRGSAAPMVPCPPNAMGRWSWWCGQDFNNVCGPADENTVIFDYPDDASIIKIAGTVSSTPSVQPTGAVQTVAPAISTASLPSSRNDNSNGVAKFVPIAVGIGVGVPLSMIAITLGFFLWKERKRRIIAERLGYAGQAVAMAKSSYEVEISAVKPALKHSTSRSRVQRQVSRGKG